ncbi:MULTISPECIES: RsiV family protein [Enterococcus]|uniref:DUF3298 domain-containing protein n=1 Tax=Candidatus Enterococcus mangumiae TaxID=2230878 RepID=A0ABZ2T1Q3_9ENTE|nr:MULTISPECIES: RsiV family protein [unclassified Enterococcus]MBO0462078.1 DUF3298 domain-containing protein [Enterococcus sp. DIV1298c]MBO0489636.1 DUF3298 domain-containing protein [Enterococcus sp. DIV1094]MBO1298453.1 DUF3298 domain-containing protein [Enterococcus sp. DIV1271a]
MGGAKKKISMMDQAYHANEIPEQLEEELFKRFMIAKKKVSVKRQVKNVSRISLGIVCSIFILFAGVQNRDFRVWATEIPILGELVSIITGKTYSFQEEKSGVTIAIPRIMGKEEIHDQLNQKYLAEGQQAYEEGIKELKKNGQQIDTTGGYHLLVNDERFLVIDRSIEQTIASTQTKNQFDTLDKQNKVVLSLPLLFKSDDYLSALSKEIEEQMRRRIEKNPESTYFALEDNGSFLLTKDPNFYINKEHQLVIFFDKYEVAPGAMGTQEFIIDTNKIKPLLSDPNYLN